MVVKRNKEEELALLTQNPKHIGRLLNMWKRYFDDWANDNLFSNGYQYFKMAYMPFIMNISPEGSTNNEIANSVFDKLKKYTNVSVSKSKKYTHLFLLNTITLTTRENDINKKITKFVENINNLEKGGSLVIKIKDTVTMSSMHLIYMLSYLFEDVYIYRPEFSYTSHGEKYIVCTNFSGKQFKYNTDKDYLQLNNVEIPSEYIFTLNIINRILMQEEYITLSIMRTYIESQNYYGEEYHKYLSKQESNSDKWISNNLMLSSKDYDELTKIKEDELDKSIEEYTKLIVERTKMYL